MARRARRPVCRRNRDRPEAAALIPAPAARLPVCSQIATHRKATVIDASTVPPVPVNEAPLSYAPASPERTALQDALTALAGQAHALDACIGGDFRPGGGEEISVVMPHD